MACQGKGELRILIPRKTTSMLVLGVATPTNVNAHVSEYLRGCSNCRATGWLPALPEGEHDV